MRTALVLLAIVGLPASAQDFSGRVVGITDGDTPTVLNGNRDQVRVRLAEIDAPEDGQPYGARARQMLSDLAFRRDVVVRYVGTDNYGRIVVKLP